ncbi:LAETG motif-containing sortase-dependent surface protein [Streptomyces sp. NBC_00882]|uniref:LAETG motif-containing sortase-dependent surface protein n=1 Tax=Streptomyces sp. NBC_00882 TaxID=2975856 RepID=UPI0038690ED2
MSRPIRCCHRRRGRHPELGAGRECRALRTDLLGLRRYRRDTGFGRGQRRDHYEGHGRRRLARRRVPAARLRRPGSRTRTERREPTHRPTDSPSSPGKPNSGTAGATPSASGSDTPEPDSSPVAATSVNDSTQKTPTGSLAHTGADATPWLIGGAAVLIAAGGGALLLARRSRTES